MQSILKQKLFLILVACIAILGFGSIVIGLIQSEEVKEYAPPSYSQNYAAVDNTSDNKQPRTIVLYVFGGYDPYIQGNLLYFIRHGIMPGVDYVIIIQGGMDQINEKVRDELNEVQGSVKVVVHQNSCFDWGTHGWYILKNLSEIRSKYTYVILMNSSIRGPFYPAYGSTDWVQILIQQISKQQDMKLLGATINCERFVYEQVSEDKYRHNAHVQSYLMILEMNVLDLWLQDPYIFQCHQDLATTIHYGEFGASLVVLEGGYNIGSLQLRYQGVDFRDESNWVCNGNQNPTNKMLRNDGINISPLETLFVKVKSGLPSSKTLGVKLSMWSEQARKGELDPVSNSGELSQDLMLGTKAVEFRAKKHCWDALFYVTNNKDLKKQGLHRFEQLWTHFIDKGFIQGREFKFQC